MEFLTYGRSRVVSLRNSSMSSTYESWHLHFEKILSNSRWNSHLLASYRWWAETILNKCQLNYCKTRSKTPIHGWAVNIYKASSVDDKALYGLNVLIDYAFGIVVAGCMPKPANIWFYITSTPTDQISSSDYFTENDQKPTMNLLISRNVLRNLNI